MANLELVEYIKKQLVAGRNREEITKELTDQKWLIYDIEDAFRNINMASQSDAPEPPQSSPQTTNINTFQNTEKSSSQTKSNLWAAATIWANQFLVGIISVILISFITVLLPTNFKSPFSSFSSILIFFISIYAIWLGVRSVRKKTSIEPKNYLTIALYSLILPFLFELGILTLIVVIPQTSFPLNSLLIYVSEFIVGNVYFGALVYYFLSKNTKIRTLAICSGILVFGIGCLNLYLTIQIMKANQAATQAAIQELTQKSIQNDSQQINSSLIESTKQDLITSSDPGKIAIDGAALLDYGEPGVAAIESVATSTNSKTKAEALLGILVKQKIITQDEAATILSSNPNLNWSKEATLLQETRDSQRVSDILGLKSAVALYLSTVYDSKPFSLCKAGKIYSSANGTNKIDGTGWVPIDFRKISAGSPFSTLPMNLPADNSINSPLKSFPYLFACDPATNNYEFATLLESDKNQNLAETDGGISPTLYEVGTIKNLITGY